MQLEAIQRAFYRAIHDPGDAITNTITAYPTQYLQIYRDNYQGTLLKTLKSIFSQTLSLYGNNAFRSPALQFIKVHASNKADLNQYGFEFPDYLEAYLKQQTDSDNWFYLADIARLDWRLHQSYYAENGSAFDSEVFMQLAPEAQLNTLFRRLPSVSILSSQWNLSKVIHLCDEKSVTNFDAVYNPSYYVIKRTEGKPCFQPIEEDMYDLLNQLAMPMSIAMLEKAEQPLLLNALPMAIQNGWVTDIK
ncbi:MAG: DNA-binding domain-containing protein [Pseudomonadota bacterium]